MLTLPPRPHRQIYEGGKASPASARLNALTKAEYLVLQNLLVLKKPIPQRYTDQTLPLALEIAGYYRSTSRHRLWTPPE